MLQESHEQGAATLRSVCFFSYYFRNEFAWSQSPAGDVPMLKNVISSAAREPWRKSARTS